MFAAPGLLGHSVSPGEDAGFAAAPPPYGRGSRECEGAGKAECAVGGMGGGVDSREVAPETELKGSL